MVLVGTAPILRASPARVVVRSDAPRLGRPAAPARLPGGHRDQLVVVEAITEEPLMELRGAVLDRASWVLNGVGSLSWAMSSWDPALLDCLVEPSSIRTNYDGTRMGRLKLLGREVQWWRDGVIRWAGVPVSADVDLNGTVSFNAFDLGWYLTRRFFGAAERRDLLDGKGSMDRPGIPGWLRNGSVVATRDTGDKVRGAGSAALTGTGSIVTSFTHPPTGLGVPLAVHLTVQAKIPSGTPEDTLVASIEVRASSSGPILHKGEIRTDEAFRLGAWEQHTTYTLLPPGPAHVVTVRLHSPGTYGTTRFDDVRSLKNDTTGIPVPGADLATHAVAAMVHFQEGRGQGTFGLRPVVLTNSGTVEVMGVRHQEHTQALDYLATLTNREDGIDWRINPANRRFEVARRHGEDHVHLQFHERNIAAGGWSHDEQERASATVVLGNDSGPDRAEGGYTNTSKVGGLVLQTLVTPPNETPLSALDPMAKEAWARLSDPQVTPTGIRVPGEFLGELEPGDRVPTTLRSGVLMAEPLMRVQTLAFDFATEMMEVA